ncbi:MAG: hypothetical protein IIY94_07970 [Oscillospiraceae bacterium]|nr:hypothetical protein [Oscillospiraceae bacterium]
MRKHRFPTVLLCLTLVVAILVSGLTVPGFLLPLLGPEKSNAGVADDPPETLAQDGTSEAFTVTPVEGVTVSAPENAVGAGRTLSMAPATEAELKQLHAAAMDDLPSPLLLLDAWEFDLGLADDELLPGAVELSLDLETLGIDASLHQAVTLYRVDDAGKWYEYSTSLDGHTLRAKTQQNSLIVLAIGWGLIVGGIMGGLDLGIQLGYGGYMSLFRDGYAVKIDGEKHFRIILDASAVKKVMQEAEVGFTGHEKALLAEAEEKAVFQAVRESYLDQETKDKILKHNEPDRMSITRAYILSKPSDQGEASWVKNRATALAEKYAKEVFNADPAYNKMQQQYQDFQAGADTRNFETLKESLEQVKKTEEYLQLAWVYLRDEVSAKMPTYVMEVHLSAKNRTDSYGATVTPFIGHPYLMLYMEWIGSGTKASYDGFLLTIVHELFHAIERGYVLYSRANYGFDEMLAQCVEWDACEYFTEEGTITTPKETLLSNLVDTHYFAIPLDSYSTSYPEGKIGGEKASVSYPRAPFLHYLQENCGSYYGAYSTILLRYKSLSGHRYLTTILKRCFNLSEEGLTEEFHKYAVADQTRFYQKAVRNDVNAVFAPIADATKGKAEIKLLNKNYTIRVRRVKVAKSSKLEEAKDKQYALAVKFNDDYRDVMADFALTPMNMEEFDDYKDWKQGIFIEARDYPKDLSAPAVYLLEADGGTASSTEGYIYNSYSGYTIYPLYALPEPELEVKNSVLSVKPPEALAGAEAEIVDSVVITILLDQAQLAFEQVKYEGWKEPWTLDLSKLKLNGKALTAEQLKQLRFTWQQCVTGTFEYGPCLGPGEPIPIETGVDITGKWDMHSATNNLDLDWLYQYVDMMPEEVKSLYGPYLEQLRTAAGDFVMEISEAKEDASYGYEVRFVYPEIYEQPPAVFEGAFDEKTMRLRLTPKSDALLSNGMELLITVDGATMTCSGTASYSSDLASYDAEITGTKQAK